MALPNLSILWDASKEVGYSDTQSLSLIKDHSGNGFGAVQGTALNRPVYRTNIINGLPVFRFDGTNSYAQTTKLSLLNAKAGYTLYTVSKRTASTATQLIFSANYASNARIGLYQNLVTSNLIGNQSRRISGGASVLPTFSSFNTNFHVIACTMNYLTGITNLYLDGVLVAVLQLSDIGATNDALDCSTIYLGAGLSAASPLNGDVAMFAFCEAEHTESTVLDTMKILKDKYAL